MVGSLGWHVLTREEKRSRQGGEGRRREVNGPARGGRTEEGEGEGLTIQTGEGGGRRRGVNSPGMERRRREGGREGLTVQTGEGGERREEERG